MRLILTFAALALALAACSNNDQADNTQNVDENLTAENIVANDVTAIDAVTGEDANMAADVELNVGDLDNGTAAANEAAPKAKKPARKAAPAADNAEDAAGNAE